MSFGEIARTIYEYALQNNEYACAVDKNPNGRDNPVDTSHTRPAEQKQANHGQY